jgi:hypothetical protein
VILHTPVVANMVVPVVAVTVGIFVALLIVGHHHPAFGRGGVFKKVERVAAGFTK